MHLSQRIKGYCLLRNATRAVWNGAQLALLLCGLLAFASALAVLSGTMASHNSGAFNLDKGSGLQAGREYRREWSGLPEARS